MRLRNGKAMSNTGFRLIVFRRDGGLAPIVRYRERGYIPDRGTSQLVHLDDLVALNIWDSRSQRLYLCRVTSLDNAAGEGYPDPHAWDVLWEGPAELALSGQPNVPDLSAFYSFLHRTEGRTPSYLKGENRGDAK